MEGLHREQEKPKFEVLKTIGGSDANKLVNGTLKAWTNIVSSKILGESKDLSNVFSSKRCPVSEPLLNKRLKYIIRFLSDLYSLNLCVSSNINK